MSIALMTEAWKSSLPMTEKMVLLCLADFANDRGECWPSIDTIAAKCSCSDRTVQKAIRSLKEWGILTIKDAPGKSHSFTINPRISFTPEKTAPPKNSAKGVKNIRLGGESASPKPSENHQEPSLVKSPPSDDAPLTIEEVVEDWNEMAAEVGLPLARKITTARRRAFKARLRDYPDIADWRRALLCIRNTPWMHGENDRGWQADIDFLLQARSFTKLTEDAYGQTKRRVA